MFSDFLFKIIFLKRNKAFSIKVKVFNSLTAVGTVEIRVPLYLVNS